MRSSIQPLHHGHTHHLLLLLKSAKDLVKSIEKLILIGRRSERRGNVRRKGMPICSNAHTSHVAPEPLDVFIAKIEACLGRHLAARRRRRRRRRRSGGAGDGGGGGRERREEL